MDIADVTYSATIVATIAFAITAVMAVSDRDIDLFGAFFLGIVTAVGGGTIRDIILDVPVFWSIDHSYIWVALVSSIVAYIADSFFSKKFILTLLLYLDGLGAALFAILAVGTVWDLGFGLPLAPVILGVITAIGGGLIRDIIAGRKNLLMTREIYAIPLLIGCIAYVILLTYFPSHQLLEAAICVLFIFLLRAAAIYWKLSVPHWFRGNTNVGRSA